MQLCFFFCFFQLQHQQLLSALQGQDLARRGPHEEWFLDCLGPRCQPLIPLLSTTLSASGHWSQLQLTALVLVHPFSSPTKAESGSSCS